MDRRSHDDDATKAPLTVARIPALVREVDVIVRTFAASRLPTDPDDVVELCEGVLTRIEEIDVFRQTLRPGPLEAIVLKQITRLSSVIESLHASGSKAASTTKYQSQSREPVVLVDTRRRRSVTSVHGNLVIKRAPSVSATPGSASQQVNLRLARHPKPIYKWEKRRHHHITPSHGSPYARNELMDDDADEACMELRPCEEPGHYERSSMGYAMGDKSGRDSFDFQILFTEAEVQALKFQRRQLQAEQRHLRRQQAK